VKRHELEISPLSGWRKSGQNGIPEVDPFFDGSRGGGCGFLPLSGILSAQSFHHLTSQLPVMTSG